jgi:N-methylhydantoinase A/oxoprolinase/acetone carboxylase beta subunit
MLNIWCRSRKHTTRVSFPFGAQQLPVGLNSAFRPFISFHSGDRYMLIGIDVGGTHADGVLLDGTTIAIKKKVAVNQRNLQESIITLLTGLLPDDPGSIQRIQLSTTLCTNAIVANRLDPVGMLIQAGPGMNPDFLDCGNHTHFLSGAIDHRGQILRDPPVAEINAGIRKLADAGITSVGIVTKFSHRNSGHELAIRNRLGENFDHVSLGHRMSGLPNFPRRVYTTWINSGLMQLFNSFKKALHDGMTQLGLHCPCYILKADGGTMPFATACEFPCQAIHSGPSASVMGGLALQPTTTDSVLLDIGGTTTDICLFAAGMPLLEPYGATVAGRPTLIRALQTKSIGLGGDSRVLVEGDDFHIGPDNSGNSMASGGSSPTPTDAMVVLNRLQIGDVAKAREAMHQLRPDLDPEETATRLLKSFCKIIRHAMEEMIDELFQRPVYTVADFLQRERITPSKLVAVGGPAEALAPFLHDRFGLTCVVPQAYEVANAVGAARARLTLQASLYADSGNGRLTIPECSLTDSIRPSFSMAEAEARLDHALRGLAAEMGMHKLPTIEFCERLEMNTVRGFATTGKIINLKAQLRPGLAF